jgi:hypothetical protein
MVRLQHRLCLRAATNMLPNAEEAQDRRKIHFVLLDVLHEVWQVGQETRLARQSNLHVKQILLEHCPESQVASQSEPTSTIPVACWLIETVLSPADVSPEPEPLVGWHRH